MEKTLEWRRPWPKAGIKPGTPRQTASAAFWRSRPSVVAIDAEGTHLEPPLLMQVASDTSKDVLIVQPSDSVGPDLTRLLADDAIKKCFFGRAEERAIGVYIAECGRCAAGAGPGEGGEVEVPAEVAASWLRGAPYAKDKKLQRSFGFVRDRNWRPSRSSGLMPLPPSRVAAAAAAVVAAVVRASKWRRGGGGGGTLCVGPGGCHSGAKRTALDGPQAVSRLLPIATAHV